MQRRVEMRARAASRALFDPPRVNSTRSDEVIRGALCNRVTFISFILSYLRHTSLMFCFPLFVLRLYLFLFYFIFQDSLLVDYKSCSYS
jgi:hypothetical protein